jgi:hypothetical protein
LPSGKKATVRNIDVCELHLPWLLGQRFASVYCCIAQGGKLSTNHVDVAFIFCRHFAIAMTPIMKAASLKVNENYKIYSKAHPLTAVWPVGPQIKFYS